MAEYEEILARPKFDLPQRKVQNILELIRSKGVLSPTLAESFQLPDVSDEVFLEAALAAKAHVLITGNKEHFPKHACKGQRVSTPKEFLEKLED